MLAAAMNMENLFMIILNLERVVHVLSANLLCSSGLGSAPFHLDVRWAAQKNRFTSVTCFINVWGKWEEFDKLAFIHKT